MSWNIKVVIILIIFMLGLQSNAQKEKISSEFPRDTPYGIIQLSVFYPIAMGDNFANKGLTAKPGFQLSALANLFQSGFLVGLQYSHFTNDVKNVALTGNYEHGKVSTYGPVIGYLFLPNTRWRFLAVAGVGPVQYNNENKNYQFSDEGTSVWLSPEIAYHFNKNFGIYAATQFRRDFLNIEAPNPIHDFFRGASYISPTIGISNKNKIMSYFIGYC